VSQFTLIAGTIGWETMITGSFEQATKNSQAASRFRTIQVCPKEIGRRFVVTGSRSGGIPMSNMRRRAFISLLGGAAAWPLAARAQQPKMLRVGYSGILPHGAPHYVAFEKRMAELSYHEGRNFTFEYIQSPSFDGYELTYRELSTRKVDILLAAGNEPALRAAVAARGATPIVFIALDFDPVERGYVASLSRPRARAIARALVLDVKPRSGDPSSVSRKVLAIVRLRRPALPEARKMPIIVPL
jgi:hypothetical protein